MRLPFTKMHGISNDYVYVNAFATTVSDAPVVAQKVSDRRTGIGGDGLILICPSETAHARMEMYNADGSRGKMCGNGIRCVGKYVYDHGLVRVNPLKIDTDTGVKTLFLELDEGKVSRVKCFISCCYCNIFKILLRFCSDISCANGPIARVTAVMPYF